MIYLVVPIMGATLEAIQQHLDDYAHNGYELRTATDQYLYFAKGESDQWQHSQVSQKQKPEPRRKS
jgi:chromosome segregation and condensation protein ScpB